MKYIKIISAAVVLAICVAAAYQLLGKRERRIKEEFSDKYFIQNEVETEDDIIKPNQIVEIHIVNPQGELNFVRNEQGGWLITQPVRTAADAKSADGMTRTLVFMEVDRVVEKNSANLERYGLESPDIKIRYRLRGSDEWHKIHFGRRSPVEGSYYAMDPDKGEVVLVNYQYKFEFNGNLQGYRDRRLFTSLSSNPDSIYLDFKDKSYYFRRDYTYKLWRMEKPQRAIARNKEVESIINLLDNTRIAAFLPPDERPEETGFDNPSLALTLELPDSGVKKLVVGNAVPDKEGFRYAKSSDRDDVFLVREELWLEKIPQILDEAEGDRPLRFFLPGAEEITFRKNGKELKFIRKGRGGRWKISGSEELELDFMALRKVVKKLNDFKIRERTWVSANEANQSGFGFDNPAAIIAIKYREAAMRPDYKAVFGDEDPSGEYVYLYSTLDPQIRLVDKEILRQIPVEAQNFVSR